MPCDTITTISADIGKMNVDLLIAALKAKGERVQVSPDYIYFGVGESYEIATGKLNVSMNRNLGEMRQAYRAEVVKSQAKRFGWTLKEVGKYEYEVIKR